MQVAQLLKTSEKLNLVSIPQSLEWYNTVIQTNIAFYEMVGVFPDPNRFKLFIRDTETLETLSSIYYVNSDDLMPVIAVNADGTYVELCYYNEHATTEQDEFVTLEVVDNTQFTASMCAYGLLYNAFTVPQAPVEPVTLDSNLENMNDLPVVD